MNRTAWVAATVLSLAATPAFAQGKTNIEQGLSKTGAVIVKSMHVLDLVEPSEGPGSLTLSATALSNPKDPSFKPKGIAIAIDDSSDRPDSTSLLYVDLDEVDALIGGLEWMIKSMGEWEGKEDAAPADVAYTTKSGFSAGFSFAEGKTRGHAKAGNSRIVLDKDGLATLAGVLRIGRDHLKGFK